MNENIQKRLRDAFAGHEDAPPFDATWHAAESLYAQRRRRLRTFTGVAAAVVAIAFVFYARTPEPVDEPLIEMGELLGSTLWQAPSDALLPEHRIDLYEELPALIGTPDPGEGALL
jgi:hypothetical protein